MAFATPAFAQDDECTAERAAAGECTSEVELQSNTVAEEGEQNVLVTGSRIRRPNLESTVPITSLGGEQIFQQGDTNVGETLNNLPQLRSTFAQQNPGLGIGIAGLNLLDLRGLGTSRTLVLVNGRRHVPADILNNAVSPDINTIPSDLIERVDIVTGGNSAIYGSDAIAGVVNFILRRDFEGFQFRGHAGINEEGFGGNQYVSGMYGMNFGDGRGNVTVHGEYAHQERIFASQVPWLRQNNAFAVIDVDTPGLPSNSDNFPDRTFFRDIRSASIFYGGLVPITQPTGTNPAPGTGAAALCGTGIAQTNGAPGPGVPGSAGQGTAYNCTYLFTPDGRLTPQTGTRFGQGVIGGIVGGNGQTGREGQIVSVFPFTERYNFNLLAHYAFSDALEVFAEAKWNRVNALGNNAGPSFIQGTFGTADFRERVRIDNPFLNPTDRETIRSAILASNCNTDLVTACAPNRPIVPSTGVPPGVLTPAQRAQVVAGTYRFVISRLLTDVGLRDEAFQRDTWRIVGGVRGSFFDDWNYEVSANLGKFEEDITTDGFIDRQRFALALDAGRDPVTGAIRCRSQFAPAGDPSLLPSQRGETGALATANLARLPADIAACVPYNPFGNPDNSASVAYFARTFTAHSELEQLVFSGFVSGDSSSWFELPGGPVSFALGAEYRRETAFYQQDPFVTDGFTNGVSIPTADPDPFEVKEAFAELRIPILADMPFFHELSLSGAARVADYGGSTGTVWAYNAGVDWAPIRDLRFRGNYSRAVRAPNVSETAFPVVPNFAPGFVDPCSPGGLAQGSTTRSANCLADLGAALLPTLRNRTYSLPVLSGSNADLEEETSDSWTLGAVIQPRFLPGFSLSIDYYDITVDNVIVSLAAQTIANSCYDSPSLDNTFCQQFTRWRGPGPGPGAGAAPEEPGDILNNSLLQAPLNFASRRREGIDFNLAYRIDIDEDVRVNTNLIYTHNLTISNFQDPVIPDFENRILGEVGDPEDEFRWDVDVTYKEFTLGYRLNYISSFYISTFEDQNSINDLPPANADFADVLRVPAVFYHNFRIEWNLEDSPGGFADELRFYVGVDNVFDRHPPLGSPATGSGPGLVGSAAIWDPFGRQFYAGARFRF